MQLDRVERNARGGAEQAAPVIERRVEVLDPQQADVAVDAGEEVGQERPEVLAFLVSLQHAWPQEESQQNGDDVTASKLHD